MKQNLLAVLLLVAGLAISSVLIILFPKYWITLLVSTLVFILAIVQPNVGIVILLAFLYFPIFPNVPISSLRFSVSTIPVLGLFFVALARLVSGKARPIAGWQVLILLALAVVFSFSTINSTFLSASMQMVPNLVIYILILFSMFVLIEKPGQVLMIVRTILILTILLFLYRWNVLFIKTGAIYLGLGSIGGSNGVAMTALPAMAICMVGIMLQPAIFSRRMQLFLFGELGFLVVMLIWSQTRGAWLGASVVFFLVLTRINKPRLLLASILMSLFLVGAYYFFQPVIESNTSQTDTTMHAFFGNENYEDINSDDQVRLYSRDAGIKLFWDRPYLGWGVNTFDKLKPKYYEGPSSQLQLPGAFNAWLWILVDMGLIGVVVIAMIFLTPITLAWAKRMYRSEEVGALAFSLALGVVGLSVHLFFVDLIYTSFIWLQVGIAIASVRLVMLGEEIEVSEDKAYNQPMGALN